MKKNLYLLLVIFVLQGCCFFEMEKYIEEEYPVKISCYAWNGDDFSGEWIADQYQFKADTLIVGTNLIENYYEAKEYSAKVDNLSYFYNSDYLFNNRSLSEQEEFAINLIRVREAKIQDKYINYCVKNGLNHFSVYRRYLIAGFFSMYIDGEPKVTSTKTLFGQPAGTDISKWFKYEAANGNPVDIVGQEYEMIPIEQYGRARYASDFFIKDKLLQSLTIEMIVPDEMEKCYPNSFEYLESEKGDIFISIPVRYEKYWQYCKELFSNPDAVLETEEMTVKIRIPFVVKK